MAAHQAPPSLGFSRQEHWSGLPFPSPDLSPTDLHIFKQLDNFLQEKCFHKQQDAENAFQEFMESQSMYFYATGINLFLIGKNVLIVMVPILINKDIFEPSYNDLKFMVWNRRKGNGTPLQYSCLENPMDGGAW